MKHNDILVISRKINKKLVQSATDVKRDPNADAVHNFRLTYKKFRSFLCLLAKKKGGNEGLQISNKLKSIYHLLGQLRDLQLLQSRLCSEKTVWVRDEYKKAIAQRIAAKKELIRKVDIEQAVSKSMQKIQCRFPRAISLIDIELYRDDQWTVIKQAIINLNGTDECIHAVRKSLKNIYFITILFRAAGRPLYQTDDWQGKDEAFFLQLMKELGDYNDLHNAIDILSQDVIISFPANDPYLLEPILEDWKNERLKKRARLVAKLQTQVFPELEPIGFK